MLKFAAIALLLTLAVVRADPLDHAKAIEIMTNYLLVQGELSHILTIDTVKPATRDKTTDGYHYMIPADLKDKDKANMNCKLMIDTSINDIINSSFQCGDGV